MLSASQVITFNEKFFCKLNTRISLDGAFLVCSAVGVALPICKVKSDRSKSSISQHCNNHHTARDESVTYR